MPCSLLTALALLTLAQHAPADSPPRTARLRGAVVDADTGQPLAARVYIQGEDGSWHFPKSASPAGSAVLYQKQARGNPRSVEMHTTLSAHPFTIDLPPGRYTLTVVRGKEYFPESRTVTLADAPVEVTVKLRRWIDLAARGWYSGDTHVHRTLEELPNVQLAEDLNVAFPLTYWVTEAFTPPRSSAKSAARDPAAKLVEVDPTHVFWPRNTEYEIFTVRGKPHTLGAFFVLNHQKVLAEGVPPVAPIGEQARQEGALLELDKHNWPWSMMLVPVLGIDLYELANNHVWRTEFGFPTFGEAPAEFMRTERDARGFTEAGWIDFGFRNYYTLLNCGFRLRPTAGTASGVHPVPLGFGRVYVHCGKEFSYDAWVRGLDAGRSFVTTGPMLFAEADGRLPGHVFRRDADGPGEVVVTGTAVSAVPLGRIEVVVNGEVARRVQPANRKTAAGAYETPLEVRLPVAESSWLAVRCFEERPDGRVRFAHTAPWHVEVAGKPLRPRRKEVLYLVKRAAEQFARSIDVLPREAVEEYREALRVYRGLLEKAR